MDVHTWIANDLVSVRDKLHDSVLSVVPTQRWVEQADDGGSSIAHLLLHVARHQDLAVTTAIRDHPPLFVAYAAALGLHDAPPSAGLAEREDTAVTAVVALEPLLAYVDAAFAATRSWLDSIGTMALDTIPDTSRRLTELAALSIDDVGWLHRMWSDKPVWWLVQWPVVGHGHAHVGEAISVRNRMGLSPF
jgi:DinB superfamily